MISEKTGIEPEHTSVALQALEDESFADSRTVTVPWYYTTRKARLWAEQPHPQLLGKPFLHYQVEPPTMPDRLPPQFWWMFWSGLDPMLVRLPEHAWFVASRMIRSDIRRRNLQAETWALHHLPVWSLKKMLTVPGYAGSPIGDRIARVIARRQQSSW